MVRAKTALFLVYSAVVTAVYHPKIDRRLSERESNTVMIVMKKTTTRRRLQEPIHPNEKNRGKMIANRVKEMTAEVEEEIRPVLDLLEEAVEDGRRRLNEEIVSYNKHWMTNQMSLTGASDELLLKLANMEQVGKIRLPEIIPISQPIKASKPINVFDQDQGESSGNVVYDEAIRRVLNDENQWNIDQIEAPRVWSDTGYTGQGIVVASIDTGVRGTHAILKNSYVGAENYGWYDPYRKSQEPTDYNAQVGHGTHTTGTMVGSHGIGVAPGAKWMACAACDARACYEEELIACAEFMACPHDYTGNKTTEDCSKAPHIINNSWGIVPGGDSFYQDVVDTWRELGIIPIFAIGNSGFDYEDTFEFQCKSAASPADYHNVIAVGATTIDHTHAAFSSKRPAVDGLVKPDISGPGHEILSSSGSDDGGAILLSGTSMAAPQVAGLVALMLSRDNSMEYDQVFQALKFSADTKSLVSWGLTCGGTPDTEFPNNIFGHGRINAYYTMIGEQVPAPVVESETPTPEAPISSAPVPVPAPAPAVVQSEAPTPAPVV